MLTLTAVTKSFGDRRVLDGLDLEVAPGQVTALLGENGQGKTTLLKLALGVLAGADLLGWVVTTAVWTDAGKALSPLSKTYSGLGGVGALVATYAALLAAMTVGAAALKADLKRFALGFTAVFWISYLCWIAGSYANFAVTTPAASSSVDACRIAFPAPRILNEPIGWMFSSLR